MSKTLPNIILTPEELENIKKNSSSYVSGAEGIIIKEPDRRVVKKILLSEVKEDMDKSPEDIEQIRRNKQSKIIRLGTMETLKNELQVSATITNGQGKFIGYEMTSSVPLYPLDTNPFVTVEEKVEYLKQLKRRLEDFHHHGIIYGDIKESNILWNNEQGVICFCDLDNIQIGSCKIDLVNYSISNFVDENGYISTGADEYMFNILTLQQLFYPNLDYRNVIEKLKRLKPGENATKEFAKTLRKMKRATDYYDGGYLIDYLRK